MRFSGRFFVQRTYASTVSKTPCSFSQNSLISTFPKKQSELSGRDQFPYAKRFASFATSFVALIPSSLYGANCRNLCVNVSKRCQATSFPACFNFVPYSTPTSLNGSNPQVNTAAGGTFFRSSIFCIPGEIYRLEGAGPRGR